MSALTPYSLVLSFISLVFISASAVKFAPPVFRTDKKIKEMCETLPDSNPIMENALKEDWRNSQIGFFFLSLGFAFQSLSILIQLVYSNYYN